MERDCTRKVVFVSNYLNHHQIPFCEEMCRLLKQSFAFIQTEPMEQERVDMGWKPVEETGYLFFYYKEPELCKKLIADATVVLFGGCEDEGYIADRLDGKKPVIRLSERLYRGGQWKAVSPRGLIKKYKDHTRHRKEQVYLLCAGAYVASDFHIVRAYPGKMFKWGYFPPYRQYDIEQLLKQKGYGEERKMYLLWAGRFVDCKHPEYAIHAAKRLKEKQISFHMDIIGDGAERKATEELMQSLGLEDCVTFLGKKEPEEVRAYMEKANIYLFTSDRNEGWGAVANEAMNSGCALVAGHMIGAAPFLIKDGVNGRIFKDGAVEQLQTIVESLAVSPETCKKLGRAAYETISTTWNAHNAAESLVKFMLDKDILKQEQTDLPVNFEIHVSAEGPCTPAPVLSEKYR